MPVCKLSVGGMHALALLTNGQVYSWGCNDDGALGRTGIESKPALLDSLPRVNNISAGDSHSIAYSTVTSKVYFCGLYRNTVDGNVFKPALLPVQIGASVFDIGIVKVTSGAHHSLALTADGEVYGWGDPEFGKIGRMVALRKKNLNALRIESIGVKGAVDIFCGKQHSFYLNREGKTYAWGLNNHGQLGIGNLNTTCRPTQVLLLSENIISIAGGESHTIALTQSKRVFCWGRNDES